MRFKHRIGSLETLSAAQGQLVHVDARQLVVDELILEPIYIFLEKNQKMILLKDVFETFSEEEKNQHQGSRLYRADYSKKLSLYREAAKKIHSIARLDEGLADEGKLIPSPYFISDFILKSVSSLWCREQEVIESAIQVDLVGFALMSFFLTPTLESDLLLKAKQEGVMPISNALFYSQLVLSLLILSGRARLNDYCAIRDHLFISFVCGTKPSYGCQDLSTAIDTSAQWMKEAAEGAYLWKPSQPMNRFQSQLFSRLQRIRKEVLGPGKKVFEAMNGVLYEIEELNEGFAS